MYSILYIFTVHLKCKLVFLLQGSWIYQIITQIHLARLEAICLWLNTQVLNQSVSYDTCPGSYWHGLHASREETLHSKITIAAPQKVGIAVTTSVVSERLYRRVYFTERKAKNITEGFPQWKMFSLFSRLPVLRV